MSYLSFEFAVFFTLFVSVYWTLGARFHCQRGLLILAGFSLYASVNVWFAVLLAVYSVFIYSAGRWIASGSRSRWPAAVAISLAVLNLAFFKNFAILRESLGGTLTSLGVSSSIPDIILPVGLSFYTFASITYLVAVYRDHEKARSLPDVACYLSFFPAIIMGPIIPSDCFFRQLDGKREIGDQNRAAVLVVLAIFKIMICANCLENYADNILSSPESYSALTLFTAINAYAVELYCNFSGFINLVTAAALILGFTLPENFNMPYTAVSVQDFWKRWHMTLCDFIMRYIYFPLGGSRCSMGRTIFNLFAAFIISGLWHGCTLNFVIWGAMHGAGVAFNHINRKLSLISVPSWLGRLLTYLYVTAAWIPFRAESPEEAWSFVRAFFTNFSLEASGQTLTVLAVLSVWWVVYPWLGGAVGRLVSWQERVPLALKPVTLTAAVFVLVSAMPGTMPGLIYAGF